MDGVGTDTQGAAEEAENSEKAGPFRIFTGNFFFSSAFGCAHRDGDHGGSRGSDC